MTPALRPLLLILPLVLFAGCSDDPAPLEQATLVELVGEQDDYDGRRVEAVGVVRRFGEAEGAARLHFVVEDQQKNRVALVPNDAAEPYVGTEVVVVGVFRFSEERGRRLEIERIDPR